MEGQCDSPKSNIRTNNALNVGHIISVTCWQCICKLGKPTNYNIHSIDRLMYKTKK
jgi:hypothetical protein